MITLMSPPLDPVQHCNVCGLNKSPNDFHPSQPYYCKACVCARNKAWRANNIERDQQNQRRAYLRRKFGITLEQYAEMFKAQDGACAICGYSPGDDVPWHKRLYVDHNHETDRIRGLLCLSCNSAIGQLGDDPERIFAAACYVEQDGWRS